MKLTELSAQVTLNVYNLFAHVIPRIQVFIQERKKEKGEHWTVAGAVGRNLCSHTDGWEG